MPPTLARIDSGDPGLDRNDLGLPHPSLLPPGEDSTTSAVRAEAGILELWETRALINATARDGEDCGSWNPENDGARKETDRRCLLVARWRGGVRRHIGFILTVWQ